MDVDYETLKEIIGRDTINAGETIVYSRAVKWARNELRRNDASASDETVCDLVGEVLFLIRFPLMSIEEFAHGPAKDNILTSDEKLDVFLSITTGSASANFNRTSPSRLPSCPNCVQPVDAYDGLYLCSACCTWIVLVD